MIALQADCVNKDFAEGGYHLMRRRAVIRLASQRPPT